MDLDKLQNKLIELKQPSYRHQQIVKNYFSGRCQSFDDMTDIAKDLKTNLNQSINYSSVKLQKIQKDGHTQKALLELQDGYSIETVLMDYDQWLTVCVSSQVGCPLNCAFCATGKMGFKRNLSVEEIIDQILFWNRQVFPRYVGRVVFMGMGEPFLNWDNLISATKIINRKEGLNIGARKISISTAGIVDKIIEFAQKTSEINLAISLHSLDPNIRPCLMPVTKKYPLKDLINACNFYTKNTNRQIFFEYALIKDMNDRPKDLKLIVDFLKSNRLFYLNIIPLNRVDGGMVPSDKKNLDNFVKELKKKHLNFSVRRSFGQKVRAACGQLATLNK